MMSYKVMDKIDILNISILRITQKKLLMNLQDGVLFTPNLDHLVKLQKDESFWRVYQNADWVVCDSKILYLVLRLSLRLEAVLLKISFR